MTRRPRLDGLRALAAVTVIASHTGLFPSWSDRFAPAGLAVQLFFVLSGYLITGILLRLRDKERSISSADRTTRGSDLRRFYARRFLRIVPLYALVVATLYILRHRDVRVWIWAYVTATVNMLPALDGGFLVLEPGTRHLWSVSVEEQFYLAWPLLVLFLPGRRLPFAVALTILAGPLFRCAALLPDADWQRLQSTTPAMMDGLGCGAWLALRGGWPISRAGACAALGAFVALRSIGDEVLSPLAWALVCVYIVGRASPSPAEVRLGRETLDLLPPRPRAPAPPREGPDPGPGREPPAWRILGHPVLVYLGTISYGMYIYHSPLQWGLARWCRLHGVGAPGPGPGLFCATLGLTLGVSALSWRFFERPICGLKRFVEYE